MKKIILFSAFALSMCVVSGCGGNVSTNNLSVIEDKEVVTPINQDEYPDDINGLENYLKAENAILGNGIEMSSQFIGAKSGRKYNFKYNNSLVTVELYDFGDENYDKLSEESTDIIQNVKNTGNLKLLEREVPAVISDSGRYLMIYSDKSSESKNAEKENKTKEIFKSFKVE